MRVRTTGAARITGIPSRTLHRPADAVLIRRAVANSNIGLCWSAEIEAFLERAARDAGFARKVFIRADLRRFDSYLSEAGPA